MWDGIIGIKMYTMDAFYFQHFCSKMKNFLNANWDFSDVLMNLKMIYGCSSKTICFTPWSFHKKDECVSSF